MYLSKNNCYYVANVTAVLSNSQLGLNWVVDVLSWPVTASLNLSTSFAGDTVAERMYLFETEEVCSC